MDTLLPYKNKYVNMDAVILTCGPSLKEFGKQDIEKFCNNKLVMCVKEAVLEFENICNFHFVNETRYRKYNIKKDIIKIFQCKKNSRYYCDFNKFDILVYEEDRQKHEVEKQLLRTKHFEEHNFNNKFERAWGPGILYETVFYFCLFIGIKNVYTIGWDLVNTNTKMHIEHIPHFFSNKNKKYIESKEFNPKKKFYQEMKFVNDNIQYFYDYLKNNGMNIFVCGKQSFVNKYIPRIEQLNIS